MRTTILHILIILLALLATGCRDRHAADLLLRADAVMESAPDSARTLLDSVEPSRLGGADLALYAVLDAQSRHKLELPAPSDSLLTIAVDRYIAHGPDSLLMKALFYRAVGYQQESNIKSAAADATGAWDISEVVGNHYWMAKSAELVADLANGITNFQEELKWRRLAAENYGLAGKTYNHLTALCDLASAHLNLHHAERALALDDSLRNEVAKHPDDMDLRIYHSYASMFIQNYYGSVNRTDTLYQFLMEHDDKLDEYPSIRLIQANILLHRGRFMECREELDNTAPLLHTRQEQSLLHTLYYRLGRRTDDMDLIKGMGDSLLNDQNILISQALDQPVTTSQRDYFHSMAHSYKEARLKAEARGWWIFAIAVVLLVGSGTWYLIRLRRNESKLEEKIRQVMAVSSELERESSIRKAVESELEDMKRIQSEMEHEIALVSQRGTEDADIIRSLNNKLKEQERLVGRLTRRLDIASLKLMDSYTDRWATINMLCTQFKDGDKTNSTIIMANISRELDKMKTNEFYRNLETDINMNMDGLMSRFRTQCKALPEDLMRIAILFFAGFSNTAVALLADISQRTVSNRRKKLIEELTAINPVDKNLFIARLVR